MSRNNYEALSAKTPKKQGWTSNLSSNAFKVPKGVNPSALESGRDAVPVRVNIKSSGACAFGEPVESRSLAKSGEVFAGASEPKTNRNHRVKGTKEKPRIFSAQMKKQKKFEEGKKFKRRK